MKRFISLVMAVLICFSCASCGSAAKTEKLKPYAGEYAFFCAYFSAQYMQGIFQYDGEANDIPDQYVDMPQMKGETVRLDADGKGYLYLGEDNQGPIDRWTIEGEALQFKAGVSVFDGTITDGLMTLVVDDGFSMCFLAPGASADGISPLSLDDYFLLLYGSGS